MNSAATIKQIRKKLGMTQKEFALALEINKSNIGKWETEWAVPSGNDLLKIIKFGQMRGVCVLKF